MTLACRASTSPTEPRTSWPSAKMYSKIATDCKRRGVVNLNMLQNIVGSLANLDHQVAIRKLQIEEYKVRPSARTYLKLPPTAGKGFTVSARLTSEKILTFVKKLGTRFPSLRSRQ